LFFLSDLVISAFRGLLYGVIASFFIIFLSWIYRYFTNEKFPSFVGIILGLGILNISGGLLALLETPTIEGATEIIIASIVIAWGVNTGNNMAEKIPKKGLGLQKILKQKNRRFTKVKLPNTHLIFDISGKSRVPEEIKNELSEREMVFPSDLPHTEIERRLKRRLITDWGVGEVEVEFDNNGKISHLAISAKEKGLSEGIPKGYAAVPIRCEIMPSGLALGDIVKIYLKNEEIIEGVEIKGVDPSEKKITVVIKQEKIDRIRNQKAALIVVLPYTKPKAVSIVVKEKSGSIEKFDIQKLASSVKKAGVDDVSAEQIAGAVKNKLSKSAVPISTEAIEDSVVNELKKKSATTAKKFKKRYKRKK
jgi:transcriptional regulator NrdR family protein